jgi:hypothetical protein
LDIGADSAKLPDHFIRLSARMTDERKQNPSPAALTLRLPVWTGWAAAIAFALLSGYFSLRYLTVRTELAAEQGHAQFTAIELRSSEQKAEAERILAARQISDLQEGSELSKLTIARLTSQQGAPGETVAVVLWNPVRREGLLVADQLPPLSADETYQLWIATSPTAAPASAGLFTVDEKGTARFPFRPAQAIAAPTLISISRENKAGASAPRGPIVAAGGF